MEEQEEWPAHAKFMNSLEGECFVVLGGPVTGTREFLLVVRANDEQEIQARISRDPWSRNQLLHVTEIRGGRYALDLYRIETRAATKFPEWRGPV